MASSSGFRGWSGESRPRLAAQLAAPMLAWFAQLQLSFAFADAGCPPGGRLVLLAVSVATLLVAVAATWSSWRQRRLLAPDASAADRFLVETSLSLGAFLSLVIVAQSVPLGWFPCP